MKASARSVSLVCLALAACGGGGGGGTANPQVPVSASFPITPANAEAAAAESWKAANGTAGVAGFAGASDIVMVKPGAAKPAAGLPSSRSLVHLVQKIPFGPETFPCLVAGTITLSGNLESSTTLTAGDLISIAAEACDDGAGEVLDGEMDMDIDAFAGDLFAGLYELTMTLTLSDMQVTTDTEVEVTNGAATVVLDTTATPLVTIGIGGDSLTVDGNTNSTTLADFTSDQSVDAGTTPASYTLGASGTVDSSNLPGSVDYSTPVTFEGTGADFPHTGELFVSGDDSSARLVALDNVNVRIDIDLDDDGTVDESIETTWAALTD